MLLLDVVLTKILLFVGRRKLHYQMPVYRIEVLKVFTTKCGKQIVDAKKIPIEVVT